MHFTRTKEGPVQILVAVIHLVLTFCQRLTAIMENPFIFHGKYLANHGKQYKLQAKQKIKLHAIK